MSSTTVGNLSVELGISDDQLRAGLAAAVVQAQQAGQQIKQAFVVSPNYGMEVEENMQKLAVKFRQLQEERERSLRTARSQLLLNVGRSVQDFAAAGLMGIVNNVEQVAGGIAKVMGKSGDAAAAVAGKFTLIAVAAQVTLPLVGKMVDSIASGLGLAANNAERATTSVKGLMTGGMGGAARAEGIKADAQFLMERDDTPTKWNFLSRQLGLAADGAEAFQRNMDRSVRATALVSESMEVAARAARDQRQLQRGSTAEFDMTTSRKEQTELNKKLFQEVVDSLGGGQNLRTRIETAARQQGMNKTEARSLYGAFAEGDVGATKQVESMLDITAQKTKILNDDFERVTGAAAELRRIEEESIKEKEEAEKKAAEAAKKLAEEQAKAVEDNMKQLAGIFRERQSLMKKEQTIRGNIDDLQFQQQKTEIIGASDAFMKNFTAGTEKDPVVNAIEKQTEDLKEVMDKLKELN